MSQDITTDDTENLTVGRLSETQGIFVAGFLTRKYDTSSGSDKTDDAQERTVFRNFAHQLNKGGLSVPKL